MGLSYFSIPKRYQRGTLIQELWTSHGCEIVLFQSSHSFNWGGSHKRWISRLEATFKEVQAGIPVLSDAETQMKTTLVAIHKKLNSFQDLLGQVSPDTCHFISPFTPKSDQCQISPAAPAEILHHTVWTTWLFIANSDERWLYYQFSLPHLQIFPLKCWENVPFELRMLFQFCICSTGHLAFCMKLWFISTVIYIVCYRLADLNFTYRTITILHMEGSPDNFMFSPSTVSKSDIIKWQWGRLYQGK